jgi:hypothetical protein
MERKHKQKHNKRVRNLIVMFTLSAVILSVSTYAWFIGMRTVNVESFDVQIKAADSLLLSIDGSKWVETLEINKSNYKTDAYSGNTNSWAGTGLLPVSSIGQMDVANSRMRMFEKASLTTTPGGYRIMSSQIAYNLNTTDEVNGYVVFDLFVRNFSGTQYLPDLNQLDEEAIYLTKDSAVKVAEGGVENTGIENSVRVAFAQIGRVDGTTTDASTITGISCNGAIGTVTDGVTGICRTAQIWEPNDTKHVAAAISWYNTSCATRADEDGAYGSYGSCGTVENTKAYKTYAITKKINSVDDVDIYDGLGYNGYTNTVEPYSNNDANTNIDIVTTANDLTSLTGKPLYSYPYFTDTMKGKTGTERPTFMTLAPNSITKVRVYVYIEGQDVDNYDFASIGKKISVAFGLSKDRFVKGDIGYNGPDKLEGESTPAN